MAFQIPQRRGLDKIGIQKRSVPLEQIIAVQGQNPIATGIETAGNAIGQAVAKRNALQLQGRQLAQLASMAGETVPTDVSITPDLYEKAMTLKNARLAKVSDASKSRTDLELKLEGLRTGHTEVDPITGMVKTYPGVQGMNIAYDEAGNPYVQRQESYKPKLEPIKQSGGGVAADDKEWGKLVDTINPQKASSRSTLGMASRANLNADRAIVTLNKPMVTKAELGNVIADTAGIYAGGAPTDNGMSHQDWSTIYGKLMGVVQSLTGKPTDTVPDAIKQRILADLQEIKNTNNKSITSNLNYYEKARSGLIGRHMNEWKAARQELEGTGGSPLLPPPGGAVDLGNGFSYTVK